MSRTRTDAGAAGAFAASLRERIRREGPMQVDRFMQACLDDPAHGYRLKPQTIGAGGDFVTAPEISQAFGELIGLWCAVAWEGMGRPAPLRLIELGPGRGTLMRDALRAAKVRPAFLTAAAVHLVEISAPLRQSQRQLLLRNEGEGTSPGIAWHATLQDVPAGPAIVVGNEFLDALPVRQLLHRDGVWHERVVEAAPEGGLRFAAGPEVEHGVRPLASIGSGLGLTTGARGLTPSSGAIVEVRPGEDDLLATLAGRTEPVMALFLDYGPSDLSFGDTLQAVSCHAYTDPLSEPGTADLTAHVQFAAFAGKARAAGLAVQGPITQAEFLGRLGIAERTARLMAANPGRAGEIEAATQRLISPTGMGQLFKAVAVHSRGLPPPSAFG
jgi:NADH dehydrogenase [ubiquinone] 1 alpha subcomplex assembly factor 7